MIPLGWRRFRTGVALVAIAVAVAVTTVVVPASPKGNLGSHPVASSVLAVRTTPAPTTVATATPAPTAPSTPQRVAVAPAAPTHASVPVVPPRIVASSQSQAINAARAAVGLPPLEASSCLEVVAASNATRIAAAHRLSHSTGTARDLACGLGSSLAGENLAMISGGPDEQRAFDMLMASAPHRANILNPHYRYVAAAWAVSGGSAYLVVEFA